MSAILGLDHVLVGVRDLEAARARWERLGFTTSPRGRHIGWGTANYCLMFGDDYVELLGIVDAGQFTNGLDRFLERGEGLMGIALAAAEGAAAALAARGLHPSEPRDLARQLELPEGTVLPRFELTFLPAEETPALPAFLVRHLSPELLRRPPWLRHANGARGLVRVTTVVADPRAVADAWARLLGEGALAWTDEVLAVRLRPDQTLLFVAPDDLDALHPELEDRPATLPSIVALAVRADLAAAGEHLAAYQVEHEEAADGSLVVPPHEACGVLLELLA